MSTGIHDIIKDTGALVEFIEHTEKQKQYTTDKIS